jgi:hypothetical protein
MLQQFNEKNRDLLININGRLRHRDEAGITQRLSGLFAKWTAVEGTVVV